MSLPPFLIPYDVQSLLVLRNFLTPAAPAAHGAPHKPHPAIITSTGIRGGSSNEVLPIASGRVEEWQPLQEELLRFILISWKGWGNARASAEMMVEGAWRSGLRPAQVREGGGRNRGGGEQRV
jgi:hypothetical protein